MADGLSLVLWSLAEYFNYFSVTLIILCSGLMTAFIIRLNGDHWGRYHNGMSQGESSLAYHRDMTAFTNPFFLRMSSTAVSSLTDGVWVEMSCLVACEVHVFWGVAISPVHAALLKTGTDFLKDMRTHFLWAEDCLATERHRLKTRGKHSLHLSVPEAVGADQLGAPPRQSYPCVVVMAATDTSTAGQYTSVVAVVNVLHLKDSQCPMPTHVIAQYAKMAGLPVFNLQPLFFASDLDDEECGTPDCQPDASVERSQPARGDDQVHGDDQVYSAQSVDTSAAPQLLSTNTADSARGDGDSDSRPGSDLLNSRPGSDLLNTHEISENHWQDWKAASGGTTDCGDREPCSVGEAWSGCQRQGSVWESALPECIVCQSRPLSCSLLPCRHTCVCRLCFHKLDRCPMCRSHIESYFTLCEDDEEGMEMVSTLHEPLPQDLYSRFERFNHRLNNWLGFE